MKSNVEPHDLNFSEIECEVATKMLQEIGSNILDESDDVQAVLEDKCLDEKYKGSCVYHPQYKSCKFYGTKFDGINGLASNIINCVFYKVRFRDSGMAFSDFSGSQFMKGSSFINCSFSESNFDGVLFSNVSANGSVFDRTFFTHAIIQRTYFRHCSFEDALFQNMQFENCDLIHANLEFASFHNVQSKHSNFPFLGVLKSFGGLQTIAQNPDSTIQYSEGAKVLSAKYLFDMLPNIQAYFYKKKDFFILANINIYLGRQKDALYYILLGLKSSLEQRDFRMIRYLCKLASYNHFFTNKELRQLYEALVNNSNIAEMNNHQYQIYLAEIAGIKRLLIDNPFSQPQMLITCATSLDPNDYEGLVALLRFFEQTIKRELPQCSYYYSIRHNSPPALEYFISDLLVNLYSFISTVSFFLFGVNQALSLADKIGDIRSKHLANKYKASIIDSQQQQESLKVELLKEQIRGERLKNQKQELEIAKGEKMLWLPDNVAISQELSGKVESLHFSIQSSDPDSIPLREHTFLHL